LPAKALTYISTYHPYKKIKETAKITDDIKVITYEAEIKIDGKDCDLIFSWEIFKKKNSFILIHVLVLEYLLNRVF
jgi:hypothetical protein